MSLLGRGSRGLQSNPYSKQDHHKPQPWAVVLMYVLKNGGPKASWRPLFQWFFTAIVKIFFLIIFFSCSLCTLKGCLLGLEQSVSIFCTVPTKNMAHIDFHLLLLVTQFLRFPSQSALGPEGYWSAIIPATYRAKYWHCRAETPLSNPGSKH